MCVAMGFNSGLDTCMSSWMTSSQPYMATDKKVFVYWDNSNIFIAAQCKAEEANGPSKVPEVPIVVSRVGEIAALQRGSGAPDQKSNWHFFCAVTSSIAYQT